MDKRSLNVQLQKEVNRNSVKLPSFLFGNLFFYKLGLSTNTAIKPSFWVLLLCTALIRQLSVYQQGVNLWQRMVEFWGMFFICLRGVNFWWRIDEFQGIFFICLWGVNFWQTIDEFQGTFFICLWSVNFWWILKYVFHMFTGVWISDKEWMNFKVCFSYVYGGMNFRQIKSETISKIF